jgi:hypothetical protein
MVVGPDWNGKVPDDITGVFRSPTNLAYIIPRTFMDDTAEDRAAIQPVVSQIVAYPVSEFDRKMNEQGSVPFGATVSDDWDLRTEDG